MHNITSLREKASTIAASDGNEREQLRRVLHRMLDPNEFLSDYGIRSISKATRKPFVFEYAVAEVWWSICRQSQIQGCGGNSNCADPSGCPVNGLILRALYQFYQFYGDDFKVECPTGFGKDDDVVRGCGRIKRRLTNIFLRDKNDRRAVYGGHWKFQNDPYWRDLILFHDISIRERRGARASHQTGWTGVIAYLMKDVGADNATGGVVHRERLCGYPGGSA